MKRNVKAAAVQYQIPSSYKEGQKKIERFVKQAALKEVDIIGLPEECLGPVGYVEKGYDPFSFLSKIASKYSVYLFGATFSLDKNKKPTNNGFLFNQRGEILINQKKIVLTPPAVKQGFMAGDTIKYTDTSHGRLAILVCKDSFHRYSSWFFNELMKAKVDIVLIPSSSITVSERSVNLWTDTLKTMSMLFNVFIVAPGTVGINEIDGSQAFGHALIISPQKVVLAEGTQNEEEIIFATLKKNDLDRLRSPEAVKWQPNSVPKFRIIEA